MGVLLTFLYAFVSPAQSWWMPKCPIKLLTGWQCPGCGIQRFAHAVLQGHIREAFAYNYFLIPTLPYLALFPLRELLPQGTLRRRLSAIIEHKAVIFAYVVAYCLWFVVRNIYGI